MTPNKYTEEEKEVTALAVGLIKQNKGMPPMESNRDLKSASHLLRNGLKPEEIHELCMIAVSDPWHKPRFLDFGLSHIARYCSQLRTIRDRDNV